MLIFLKSHWKKGASTLEYMALIVFVLGAFLVFDKYIIRGFWGQWKKAGDAFGQGKEYDPRPFGSDGEGGGTLDCMFIYATEDPYDTNGEWVKRGCYEKCITTAGSTVANCRTNCGNSSFPEVGRYCDY